MFSVSIAVPRKSSGWLEMGDGHGRVSAVIHGLSGACGKLADCRQFVDFNLGSEEHSMRVCYADDGGLCDIWIENVVSVYEPCEQVYGCRILTVGGLPTANGFSISLLPALCQMLS